METTGTVLILATELLEGHKENSLLKSLHCCKGREGDWEPLGYEGITPPARVPAAGAQKGLSTLHSPLSARQPRGWGSTPSLGVL